MVGLPTGGSAGWCGADDASANGAPATAVRRNRTVEPARLEGATWSDSTPRGPAAVADAERGGVGPAGVRADGRPSTRPAGGRGRHPAVIRCAAGPGSYGRKSAHRHVRPGRRTTRIRACDRRDADRLAGTHPRRSDGRGPPAGRALSGQWSTQAPAKIETLPPERLPCRSARSRDAAARPAPGGTCRRCVEGRSVVSRCLGVAARDHAPELVKDHDFPSEAEGRAIPYGIYDPLANTGTVFVGATADTPAFAVDCIEKWWRTEGRKRYPRAEALQTQAVRSRGRCPARALRERSGKDDRRSWWRRCRPPTPR